MLQHNDQANCINCETALQLQVKYCPFCGTSQLLDLKSDPVEILTQAISNDPIHPPALVQHLTRKGKQLEGIILAGVDLDAAKTYDAYAFRKGNGIFIKLNQLKLVPDHLLSADQLNLKQQQALVKSSNSAAQAAPKPAQKPKYNQSQSQSQSQNQNQDKKQNQKPSITQHQYTASSINYSKTQAAPPSATSTQATSPDAKRAAATTTVTPSATSAAKHRKPAQHNSTAQQSTPAQSQMQPQKPLMDPFTPTSAPFTIFKLKYFLILIVAIILYLVFFNQKSEPDTAAVPATETAPRAEAAVSNCDLPNGQIFNLLKQHKPTRAMAVVEMYQQECQQDAQFVTYRKQAQVAAASAIEKFNLAQNYLSHNNIDSAETALAQALELDVELAEAHELLRAIAQYKAQLASAEQPPADELEVLIHDVETQQQAATHAGDERRRAQQADQSNAQQQAQQRQAQQAQAAQQQAKLQAQQAKQQAEQQAQQQQAKQQAEQQAKLQAQQAQQQQAKQRAEQQAQREADVKKAEQLKAQKLSNTLASADRALGQHNYATAKSLAKQAIAQDPNHPVAKRILRQAEAGEAKAFEDMVVE